jgi:MFS family permease
MGPRNTLSFYVAAWGFISIGMGFVPTWGWLALCRVLLGILEAGYFPGMVFIISTWYVY